MRNPTGNNAPSFKGRGAQLNVKNPYFREEYASVHLEGIDENLLENSATEYLETFPKKIVNHVHNPRSSMMYSLNPYQGCEHGCIYCYARNTHPYWGYSAGLDFERKILVKKNAPQLLEEHFNKKSWVPCPIVLSGNTDCYQPIERKLKITRSLLQVFLAYRNPVSIITKNALILRDLDLLKQLQAHQLIEVSLSFTTMNEQLRQVLEPRTVTAKGRLAVMKTLSENGIPVRVMTAPIIPGLNSAEIPRLIAAAAESGVLGASYTLLRLEADVKQLFDDWLRRHFPEKAEKVLHQMKEAPVTGMIGALFRQSAKRYLNGRTLPPLNCHAFQRPSDQLRLF